MASFSDNWWLANIQNSVIGCHDYQLFYMYVMATCWPLGDEFVKITVGYSNCKFMMNIVNWNATRNHGDMAQFPTYIAYVGNYALAVYMSFALNLEEYPSTLCTPRHSVPVRTCTSWHSPQQTPTDGGHKYFSISFHYYHHQEDTPLHHTAILNFQTIYTSLTFWTVYFDNYSVFVRVYHIMFTEWGGNIYIYLLGITTVMRSPMGGVYHGLTGLSP